MQGGVRYNICIYDELFDSSFDERGVELVTEILQERVEELDECCIIISHRKESIKAVTGDVGLKAGQNYKLNVHADAEETINGSHRHKVLGEEYNSHVAGNRVGFAGQNDFNIVNGIIDLQTLYIDQVLTGLDEIIVRAETSQTEFKLDKRMLYYVKDEKFDTVKIKKVYKSGLELESSSYWSDNGRLVWDKEKIDSTW